MSRILISILLLFLTIPSWAGLKADYILVDKSERKLMLLKNRKVLRNYAVSLGGNPIGHKMMRGDSKTPEGLYKITWKQEKSRFHLALHINYPSKKDREVAAHLGVDPGSDIKIHGLPNNLPFKDYAGWLSKRWDWTDGCIAVSNSEIEEIWNLIEEGISIEIRP